MQGHEHYREAERLIERANGIDPEMRTESSQATIALAQVHATLAQAAAVVETGHALSVGGLISRPMPAADGDPAYPGTGWGRAFFGDLHLTPERND